MAIPAQDALEIAVQSSDLFEPALAAIFDAHRQMIELRAAQKLNPGLLDSDGCVLVGADDMGNEYAFEREERRRVIYQPRERRSSVRELYEDA